MRLREGASTTPVKLYQGFLTMPRHRDPPLGGVAIRAARSVRAAWIASSRPLLAMTAQSGSKHRAAVLMLVPVTFQSRSLRQSSEIAFRTALTRRVD
jgi:hypothetical protein